MKFTYDAYENMIYSILDKGYSFSNYTNCFENGKTVILRHDVDYSIEKALRLAELEYKLGVRSTYFVLLTSPFYNLMAKNNLMSLIKIKEWGHEIGLHFDEVNYTKEYYDKNGGITSVVLTEANLLKNITGIDIKTVSMHRPSKETLNADYDLSPLVNSYSSYFFKEFKYLSDSRRHWKEDINKIINFDNYDKIHILTHAFWYNDEEKDLKISLTEFIKDANKDRFNMLNDNITDLNKVVNYNDIR